VFGLVGHAHPDYEWFADEHPGDADEGDHKEVVLE
jgi:hypothetical protein